MTKVLEKLKNNKIAVFTVFAYVTVFIYSPSLGLSGLKSTSSYILEMLQILPAVFIVMGLVEVWVSRDTIMRIFGKEAGLKGKFASVLIGSFSAGPIYAAFPVCYTLLKKGSAVSNIVIILSAWAVVKMPMVIVESQFMGISFMALRYLFTVPAIIMVGTATGRLVTSENIMKTSKKEGLLAENILTLLPGYSCGACGYRSCRITAEQIAQGNVDPDICGPLEEEDLKSIYGILEGG